MSIGVFILDAVRKRPMVFSIQYEHSYEALLNISIEIGSKMLASFTVGLQ